MQRISTITAHIVRTLLGVVFTFSGFVKVIDPLGTTYKIEDYMMAMNLPSLVPMAFMAAMCLVTFELVLGLCMLLNVKSLLTPWLTLAMMVFMTPLTLWIALKNPVTDCGCFGDALVISNWATFWKNVVLLALVVVFIMMRKAAKPWFGRVTQWVMVGVFIACSLCLSFYCLRHLPLIDFRPYKVGTDIRRSMEIPEGAPVDEYETTFTYEKDGVQQTFTLDNYPKDDPSWVFVDAHSTLVRKGYEPPIHDFSIVRFDVYDLDDVAAEKYNETDLETTETTDDEGAPVGEDEWFDDMPDFDITDHVLDNPGKTILVIMYDLEKADATQVAKLNDLYIQALADGAEFYALTGSATLQVKDFIARTAAAYPFCSTDPVTLKTIIRANPGIVVIEAGKITEKHNVRQL